MFVKTFFIQTLWNYERLQNVGFLFILKPFLCRIYSDEGEKKEAFLRHVGFFNTHPYMIDLIAAIVVNMEEKASENVHGEKVSDINMIKDIMTAPLAAIGDSFFWGTLRHLATFAGVFILFLFVNIFSSQFATYDFWVPLTFISFYNIVHIPARFLLMFMGFKFDRKKNIALLSSINFSTLWKIMYYSEVAFVAGASVLYLKFLFFTFLNSGNNICDMFIYVGLFMFSIFVSLKFSAVFLFYGAVLICIGISYLGI